MPLIQKLAGDLFPKSHARHYVQRSPAVDSPLESISNADHPATALVGDQADFDYDAFAVLTFDNKAAFEALHARMSQKGATEELAADEESFWIVRGRRWRLLTNPT